jgi:hypothetical protein
VFSCDYNGWADVPEEEREGIDAFEAAAQASPAPPAPLIFRVSSEALPLIPAARKAA